MGYTVIFEPKAHVTGVAITACRFESAKDAWSEVNDLMRAEEAVKIFDDHGFEFDWRQLKFLAERN